MKLPPAAAILISLFFATAVAEEPFPFQGRVKEDRINIRRDSTVSSEIVGRANMGQEVTVIRQAYDWYKIRFPFDAPSHQAGFAWIHKKFVERKPQPVEPPPEMLQSTQPAPGINTINTAGIIKPYGRVFGRKATHKLIGQDSQILFLLKGDKKRLNSFNHRKVKINGVNSGLPQNKKFPVIEVISIEEIE